MKSNNRNFIRNSQIVTALILSTALIAPQIVLAQANAIATPQIQKAEGITHGPLLGNVTSNSIRVWARTKAPAKFSVAYSTNEDLSNATISTPVETTWEHDATGWVELKGLKPNTKYYYGIILDGKIAETRIDGKANSFLTLPDSSEYVDKDLNPKGVFNFAFEVGTGNSQPDKMRSFSVLPQDKLAAQKAANVPKPQTPPTFNTMLKNLKDKIYFQIQNGDWIYETGREKTEDEWARDNNVTQRPKITSLAKGITGVWENYKIYIDGNKDLANFYREVPQFVVIDDHEIINDIVGSGETGFRDDTRGKPWQTNVFGTDKDADLERAVFRDPAVAAWRDYIAWANPDASKTNYPSFGKTKIEKGKDILTDKNADFTKLDLNKTSNLHVHWGLANTGVYKIVKVLGPHKVQIYPSFNETEDAKYSIGSNLYTKFSVANSDIFILDARSNRTLHNKANPADPKTSMIGEAQKKWLFEELKKSDADFIFITSSVNLAIPHDNGAWYGQGAGGQGKDDGWTAHLAERAELLKVAQSLGKPVFFLTGDLHKSFVAKIGPGVYDVGTGPHTSGNHRLGDAGGAPPSGWYDSGDRLVNILWSSNQYRNDSGTGAQRGKGWPIYTVVKVNNAYNIPQINGKDRWIAYPEPQVIFEFHDGYTGDLVYAHSVSTSEAKKDQTPVTLETVRQLGGISGDLKSK